MVSLDDEQMRANADSGCRFYNRCAHRMDRCLTKQPPLYAINDNGHEAACYLYDQ